MSIAEFEYGPDIPGETELRLLGPVQGKRVLVLGCRRTDAILSLARALGMETTAEGVESQEQLTELRLQGCSSVQGYLFSRPVDARAARALIAASSASAAA